MALIPYAPGGEERASHIRETFARSSFTCDEWVEAASGAKPIPFGNVSMFFTRYWLIVRSNTEITVWRAYTGPTPTDIVLKTGPSNIEVRNSRFLSDMAGGYSRARVGSKVFWVKRSDAPILERWSRLPE